MNKILGIVLRKSVITIENILLYILCWKKSSDIALIRLDAIGDFIIWLDTAKQYRALYPNQKITLIANPAWAGLARQLPYWDDVIAVDIGHLALRSFIKRWRLLLSIRRRGFHVAVHPTFSRTIAVDTIVLATGASHRIGSVGDLVNSTIQERRISNRWYTTLLPARTSQMMELLRNAEYFSNLAGTSYQPAMPRLPRFRVLPETIQFEGAYFIIFPGASWAGRQWPVEHFVEVLVALQLRYGWRPVLCGAANESALCQAIAHAAAVDCINLAGNTDIVELVEVIRGGQLLISNETSAVHIAAAVGTPAICILGGGHYGRFMPYPEAVSGLKPLVAYHPMPCFNCNWRCSMPHVAGEAVPCVAQVSVAQVLNQAYQAIAQCQEFER